MNKKMPHHKNSVLYYWALKKKKQRFSISFRNYLDIYVVDVDFFLFFLSFKRHSQIKLVQHKYLYCNSSELNNHLYYFTEKQYSQNIEPLSICDFVE